MKIRTDYYVYCYYVEETSPKNIFIPKMNLNIDISGKPIYIGKGHEDRMESHKKNHDILSLLIDKNITKEEILVENLDEFTAYWIESILINKFSDSIINKIIPNYNYYNNIRYHYSKFKIVFLTLNQSKNLDEASKRMKINKRSLKYLISKFNLKYKNGLWIQDIPQQTYIDLTIDDELFDKEKSILTSGKLIRILNDTKSIKKTGEILNLNDNEIHDYMRKWHIFKYSEDKWEILDTKTDININWIQKNPIIEKGLELCLNI